MPQEQAAGTTSAYFKPHKSAALPVRSGTMAPPTIAMQITPEPSAARSPRPSLASVKMVGNMMELNRPIATSDQADTAPDVLAEMVSNAITAAATHANTLPGENSRST